jgi:hypothetical protein
MSDETPKITVVVEMNDGSLATVRQKVDMDSGTVEFFGDLPDKDNLRRIGGNFPGWGPIPPYRNGRGITPSRPRIARRTPLTPMGGEVMTYDLRLRAPAAMPATATLAARSASKLWASSAKWM